MSEVTFTFSSNVRSFRNLLNIHRFASKDKTLPLIGLVRVQYTAGEGVLKMLATDRYTIAEVALPLSDPVEGDFEGFIRAEDVARVLKGTKVSTREMSFSVDGDRGTFVVDGVQIPVEVLKNGETTPGRYPNVDRLWPETLPKTGEKVGQIGLNTAYLDRFRHINPKTSGAASGVRLFFDGNKPAVVLPFSPSGWRGLIMGVRGEESGPDPYGSWDAFM